MTQHTDIIRAKQLYTNGNHEKALDLIANIISNTQCTETKKTATKLFDEYVKQTKTPTPLPLFVKVPTFKPTPPKREPKPPLFVKIPTFKPAPPKSKPTPELTLEPKPKLIYDLKNLVGTLEGYLKVSKMSLKIGQKITTAIQELNNDIETNKHSQELLIESIEKFSKQVNNTRNGSIIFRSIISILYANDILERKSVLAITISTPQKEMNDSEPKQES